MLKKMIRIVVDLDGADISSEKLLPGVLNALEEKDDLYLYLLSEKDLNLKEFNKYKDRYEFIKTKEAVTNNDIITKVIKEKAESSMVKGVKKLMEEDADGIVSCGATGALLCSAIYLIGRMGMHFPVLVSNMYNKKGGNFCLLDCGANANCIPEQLMDFARMGDLYAKCYFEIDTPKIGLLSNGVEEKKGNELVKAAHQLLKNSDLNFIGNIEGSNIFNKDYHVLVCDGFSGNLIIKNVEGTALTIIDSIKKLMIESSEDEKKAYQNAIDKISSQFDYNSNGGAVLLGVNKIVVKGHGAANYNTLKSIILQAYRLAKSDFIKKMSENC